LRFYQGNYSSDNANRRYALMADMTSGQNLSLVSFQDDGANYKATALLFNRDTSNTVHLAAGSVATAIIGTNATSTLDIRSESVVTTTRTTMNLFNTYATTINFGGAATNLTMGASNTGKTTVRNALVTSSIQTFVADQSSQSVAGGNIFKVPDTWTSGSITTLTGGTAGQTITIIGGDSDCSITDGSNLKLAGNWAANPDDTIQLIYDGTNWYELTRSDN